MQSYHDAATAACSPSWRRRGALIFERADGSCIELAPLDAAQRVSWGYATPAALEWLGIGHATSSQLAVLMGRGPNGRVGGSGVAVPSFVAGDIFWQARLDKARASGSQREQRYTMLSRTAWPHGLPPFVMEPGRRDRWLVIVEGAKKVLSVQTAFPNLQVVGLRGVRTCLDDTGHLNRFWGEQLGDLRGRWAMILFDTDVHTNGQVRAALLRLRDALTAAGCRVWVATLPIGNEKGPDDYLAKFGPHALGAVLNACVPACLGERLSLINTPAEAAQLIEDPVFIDALRHERGETWVAACIRLRELGVSERILGALQRRTVSKHELKERVRQALQTDLRGASIRQVLTALRRQDLSFDDHVMSATVNELRVKGAVPQAGNVRGALRRPSTSDAVLDRIIRAQVVAFGKAATVNHVGAVIRAKHLHVGRERVAARLKAIREENP